ncbi:patatin-like phospholipase family protein [Pandoraea terrae]
MTLALQGGGSHGAFTWGVLDRLLDDKRIEIEGISGASAGAMNAVVLAHGLTAGGPQGARRALQDFWETVASKAPFYFMPQPATHQDAMHASPGPAVHAMLSLTRFFSPYQLNPFDINPLRDILASQVDFERLRASCPTRLFIAATQVSTGTLRLFRTRQLTLEAVLASACLPSIHHAVTIDGEAYWDGGLVANPPLFPLLTHCSSSDTIVVLLHPAHRPKVPALADEIWHRLNEISFSSAFFAELQSLWLAKREVARWPFSVGRLERRLRRFRFHLIDAQELMNQLSTLSKLNAHPSFINALRDEGCRRAEAWLDENFAHIGARSSFDLGELLH